MECGPEVVTAYLSGELDHHAAAGIREEIDERASGLRPSLLVLDFGDVTFMDSSGIGLVMGRYRLMRSLGAELGVTGLSPRLRQMMKLAGLEALPVWEEREDVKQ